MRTYAIIAKYDDGHKAVHFITNNAPLADRVHPRMGIAIQNDEYMGEVASIDYKTEYMTADNMYKRPHMVHRAELEIPLKEAGHSVVEITVNNIDADFNITDEIGKMYPFPYEDCLY